MWYWIQGGLVAAKGASLFEGGPSAELDRCVGIFRQNGSSSTLDSVHVLRPRKAQTGSPLGGTSTSLEPVCQELPCRMRSSKLSSFMPGVCDSSQVFGLAPSPAVTVVGRGGSATALNWNLGQQIRGSLCPICMTCWKTDGRWRSCHPGNSMRRPGSLQQSVGRSAWSHLNTCRDPV